MNWKNLLTILIGSLFLASPAMAKEEGEKTEARLTALEVQVSYLLDLLEDVSRGTDVSGYDTLQFSGMNVQIVNGEGSTESTDGTGNLIIGYNELRAGTVCPDCLDVDRRTGSHMLVIGRQNNYTKTMGMVVGVRNETSGRMTSVIHGSRNIASGMGASISGGVLNTASGDFSSVSGGVLNIASGDFTSISGGVERKAETPGCMVGDSGVDC